MIVFLSIIIRFCFLSFDGVAFASCSEIEKKDTLSFHSAVEEPVISNFGIFESEVEEIKEAFDEDIDHLGLFFDIFRNRCQIFFEEAHANHKHFTSLIRQFSRHLLFCSWLE
jgi:hypothetical protein